MYTLENLMSCLWQGKDVKLWLDSYNEIIKLSHSNNNTYRIGGNMNNLLSDITVNTFNILCRMNDVMREIIRLKSENRSISQRIKTLGDKVTKLTLHIAKATTNNEGNFRKCNSYCNLIRILEDSQKRNSKLILKHRKKIQELRKDLV